MSTITLPTLQIRNRSTKGLSNSWNDLNPCQLATSPVLNGCLSCVSVNSIHSYSPDMVIWVILDSSLVTALCPAHLLPTPIPYSCPVLNLRTLISCHCVIMESKDIH